MRKTKVENHIHNHNYIFNGTPPKQLPGHVSDEDSSDGGIDAFVMAALGICIAAAVVINLVAWIVSAIAEACRVIAAAFIDIAPVLLGVLIAVGVWYYWKKRLKARFTPFRDETVYYPGQYQEVRGNKALGPARRKEIQEARSRGVLPHKKVYELKNRE